MKKRFYILLCGILLLPLLAACSGNSSPASGQKPAAAETPRRINIIDKMIKVNDINMHVVDYGGQGETVLLVHGITANARFWDPVAERLSAQYHVIALDVRGRGSSDKPLTGYYDYWQYADDISALLDALNIKKTIYVGHSMGAGVGVIFANKYPEKLSRLVLVDGGMDSPDPAKIWQAMMPILGSIGTTYPSFQEYLEINKKVVYYKDWNQYIESNLWNNVQIDNDGKVTPKTPKYVLQPTTPSRPYKLDEMNVKISVPTLLLQSPLGFILPNGESTPSIVAEKAEKLAAGLPKGSRFAAIAGSNHLSIVLNKYEETSGAIMAFLKDTK